MPGSIIELLSPEAQSFYGAAAAGIGVVGLFVWGAGIKLARPAVAVLVGVGAAALAIWGLPGPTGLAPVTAGIIGFVVGVLAGAVSFRGVQAILLAACLAVLVGGIYYRSTLAPTLPALAKAHREGGGTVATLPARDMLIATERLGAGSDTAGRVDGTAMIETARGLGTQVQKALLRQWELLTPGQQQRLGILASLAALAGLLVALFFPRHTTWICTGALGTLMIAGAGFALLQVYGRQFLGLLPTRPMPILAILAGILFTGLIVQRLVFWPGTKKRKASAERSEPRGLPGEPATA
jgi:hypothetical protein